METVTLRCVRNGTELCLSTENFPESEKLDVSLTAPNCSARLAASTYVNGSPALLFRKMAANWRGWDGEFFWGTLEGEFKMTATTDRLGHVELWVGIRGDTSPHDWELKALLHFEAGTLDQLYRNVSAVFPIHPNAPAD
jgi:hypothetical protein